MTAKLSGIFTLKLPSSMLTVLHTVSEFLEEWIVFGCCLIYRQRPTDSSLVHSEQNLKQMKHMNEIHNSKWRRPIHYTLYTRFWAPPRKKSHSWTFLWWQHTIISNKNRKTYSDIGLNCCEVETHFERCPTNLKSVLHLELFLKKPRVYIVKLSTLVEGDPKAPFSIATTPRYKGGCYTFLWIAPLYPWSLPYNVEC